MVRVHAAPFAAKEITLPQKYLYGVELSLDMAEI